MFGEELQKVMQEKGINASILSDLTGIGKSSISQYISGKHEPPDRRKEIFANKLGLPADYFKSEQSQQNDVIRKNSVKGLTPIFIARLMHKSYEFVTKGLQDGIFPWGWAVKMPSGQWDYYISPTKFTEYTGIKIE